MKLIILGVTFILLGKTIAVATALDMDEVRATLAEPQVVVLENGQVINGYVRRANAERLVFVHTAAGGDVEYTFAAAEVARLDFPGTQYRLVVNELLDNGEPQDALALLEALYRQRAPYLGYLPADEVAYFVKLVELARAQGDPYLSVGVAKYLSEFAADKATSTRLADLILLGHYQLPLKGKTRQLAAKWRAENAAYAASALGWYISSRMAYDAGEFEAARAFALEPIVFSSQYPMSYLEYCYAVAVLAAVELEDVPHAHALAQEMAARKLPWPSGEGLGAQRYVFEAVLSTPPSEESIDPAAY